MFGVYNAALEQQKRPGVAVPGSAGAQGIVFDEREMESLHKNPTIKAMLEDKEFTALIEKRDFAGMMAHPMFRRIMDDPALIKELTAAALNAGTAPLNSTVRGAGDK